MLVSLARIPCTAGKLLTRVTDCHVVAVLPEFQRRGIGALLTTPGVEVAQQMEVPVYLEATERAVRLYEKLGFRKLERGVILNANIVGKDESAEAPIMVKMPSSRMSFENWTKQTEA